MDERIQRADVLYERAVFGGDAGATATADAELDAVEADLALARGRVMHARFLSDRLADPHELALFERAAELSRMLGDVRAEAESALWIGIYQQVVAEDGDAALPHLQRAERLAHQAGDDLTLSYALRHLGFAAHSAGDVERAEDLLRRSLRLRRDLGFHAGVAMNLVGLAYLATGEGCAAEIATLLDEAQAVAEAGAFLGVLRHVAHARTRLRPRP